MFITPGPNNAMLTISGLKFGFKKSLPHILTLNHFQFAFPKELISPFKFYLFLSFLLKNIYTIHYINSSDGSLVAIISMMSSAKVKE